MNICHWDEKGRRGYITLANWRDAMNFKPGMAMSIGDQTVRVKFVNLESGFLVVHSPLWWRASRRLALFFSRLSVFFGQ